MIRNSGFFFYSVGALGVMMVGLTHLKGSYHKSSRYNKIIDLDKVFFGNIKNKIIIKKADKLAYYICLIASLLIIINLIAALIYSIPNISPILILGSLIGSWIARFIYIGIYKE